MIPRSDTSIADDLRLLKVRKWLRDLVRPEELSDTDFATFIRYSTEFFIDGERLWRKDVHGAHKLVATTDLRVDIMQQVHDNIGHKAVFATKSTIAIRFWWPNMNTDIAWFVRTCHICQIRQTRNLLIPPIVAMPAPPFAKAYVDTMHMPAPPFAKAYVDTMHMPPSGSFKYIVQGRCSLTYYPEFRMLRNETAKAIGDWIYEDILCRWGALREIVSDNGPAFVKALEYLAKRYHINHIRISGYNSRANGLVERSHFDSRQSLFKAVDGDQARWSLGSYSVFWAERITIRKRMGCSPYFAITGSHPIIPLDISEATYLQPDPSSVLSTTDLMVRRAIALQKCSADLNRLHSDVYAARLKAAKRFEEEHARTIKNFDFKRGDLVLMRNTQYVVISRNYGGAYILSELDGSVLHRPIAAFRVIPYFARRSILLPTDFIDISNAHLKELEETNDVDGDNEEMPIAEKDDDEI
jgi:hypothetical protein